MSNAPISPISSISTIIPVFNCERYVGEAIDSVLAQSLPADEIIVVDDGSTDASAGVVAGFGSAVRYTRQENRGIGAARNAGVALATGDYLAFLDADDLWTPRKLELQAGVLTEDPRIDLVFGLVSSFLSPELEPDVARRLHCPDEAIAGLGAPCMVARRAVFDAVGGFDEDLTLGEFVDWHARAVDAGCQVRVLDEVVLRRRIHGTNTGIRSRDSRQDYVRVLKAMLDRRRAAEQAGQERD